MQRQDNLWKIYRGLVLGLILVVPAGAYLGREAIEAAFAAEPAIAGVAAAAEAGHKHGADDDHGAAGQKTNKSTTDEKAHREAASNKPKPERAAEADHDHDAEEKASEKTGAQPHSAKDAHKHGARQKAAEAGPKHDAEKKDGHAHGKAGGKKDAHGHGAEEAEDRVKLSAAQLKEFAIATTVASGGEVASHISRPAEVKFNEDRIVHVVPRVDGTVKSVVASEGQFIEEGALMAVMDSRQLADAKAEYLAALARLTLAEENHDRAGRLSRRKILAERQFLESRTKFIEARIARKVAAQKLRALGLSAAEIEKLPKAPDSSLSLFYIRAPFSGIIVERHIVRGETRSVEKEALTSRKAAFVIADLSKVWVDISIYPSDFANVKKGHEVSVRLNDGKPPAQGKILFVSPNIQEETRTGFARVVLDNADGRFHPGVFLKAEIAIGSRVVKIRIPKEAVQTGSSGKVVFVKEGDAFVPRPVRLGAENHKFVEVSSGLKAGDVFVSKGAFTLKAQLGKAAFGDGHNH